MKKFAICAALVLAVMLAVPSAQAATKCYHLTNFCDGLQATQIHVGGIQANEVVGLWDWLCIGAGSGTLMSGSPNKFGTAPTYPYPSGNAYGFNANFTFKHISGLFDLYGTFDGSTTFAFQTNQPYTTTNGPCSPLGPRQAGSKSVTGR